MAAAPSFGTDGVRGVANTELTPDVALALGRAAVEVLEARRFVVGRDTRRSGPLLESALTAGLCGAGADVEHLGVVTTPAVAWRSRTDDVPGIMISASHNPFADNGIKVFAAGGLKLSDDAEASIERRYHQLLDGAAPQAPTGAEVGTVVDGPVDGVAGWVDAVCRSIDGRPFRSLRVVLDCANGAAWATAGDVYRRLGADVDVIGDRPDGTNINDGCGSTHPDTLVAAVAERGADVGLAFDGDADRLIAVDETGTVVDGDRMLAVLAADWKATGRLRGDAVVVTVMTNLGFHLAMERAGIEVVSTAVGDRYVLQALDERGLSLGGEQSGHVICRDLATTGDGVLTGVQLLDAVVRSGQPLSKLAGESMTTVPQVLRNVRLARRDDTLVTRLTDEIAAVEREFGANGRVVVRASGTEPLLRVMVEHLDPDVADRTCDRLIAAAGRLLTS
ncbi:MAG: phosphoglucosamine mutase [Acidimicrobiales bacterium]